MKYGLYSIYNLDTQEFSAPIVFKTEKMAINSFVRHIETSFQKDKRFFTPSDFDLFYIGTFSDSKGEVVSKDKKVVMLGANVDLSSFDVKESKEDVKKKDDEYIDAPWSVDEIEDDEEDED